jgi:BirA family biotin operon repressor/biotin-[acetyl-CoA-carboxylase] ligase
MSGLSLAVGVAVARTLARLGIAGVGLKWPNDVIWRGCKLAGMLIEMQGELTGPSAAVIGIGINCRLPDTVRERIDQPVTDLAQISGVATDRNRVLAMLLVDLAPVLEQFAQSGFAPLRDEWQHHHVCHDQPVRLTLPDAGTLDGIARGVDEDGALLLETSTGVRRIHSGEVSLRSKRGA